MLIDLIGFWVITLLQFRESVRYGGIASKISTRDELDSRNRVRYRGDSVRETRFRFIREIIQVKNLH